MHPQCCQIIAISTYVICLSFGPGGSLQLIGPVQ